MLGLTLLLPLLLAPASGDDVGVRSGTASDGLYPGHRRKIAGEVGLGVGLGIPHAGLGVGPSLQIDAGARFRLKFGSIAVALRGAYQRFATSGSGELPCEAGEEGPCVESNDGAYDWEVVENVGQLGLPISFRFRHPEKRFVPYLTVAPELFLMTARATSFDLDNKQLSAKAGVAALVGGHVRVGPGGIFLEAGYQYASIDHRATGEANVGAVTLTLGYRFVL